MNSIDPQSREAADLMARVRVAMKEQNVNQSELARRCGFSRAYISRLFSSGDDRREATLPTALLLAHKLGVVRIIAEEGGR
ncbi:helix-turn-helix transcriptional regulator [Sphingomonas sanguinis]|uniref:helix-turn-helix domain-containing protein n=1 Tax=Sphingomonas sp. LC-1 TaxID=3110957 RepID=UPI0021BBA061|nr:helix-turn-helix transcriptional regulator [Sphingomonas sp. LC-1]MCT8000586.1 helix-turn-helix transcriptional regulator [Sphingomonas sp. LC-1]